MWGLLFWRFIFWLSTPPENDICYENCPGDCDECGWWRAIA